VKDKLIEAWGKSIVAYCTILCNRTWRDYEKKISLLEYSAPLPVID